MWWLQNNSNSSNAQKWQFLKPFQMMSIIQLVVVMVSLVSAQMQYPPEKEALVQTDNNILLSLPFLNVCLTVQSPVEICSMYYDMVYNVYSLELNGDETKKFILEANQHLENSKLTAKFCNIFRNESRNVLDKQPFSTANNITNVTEWIQMDSMCELNCMEYKNRVLMIKDICKFISGGLKSILKEKKIKEDLKNLPLSGPGNGKVDTDTKPSNEKKPENSKNVEGTIKNENQKSIQTSVEKSVGKAASNALPNTSTSTNSNHTSSNPASTKSLRTQLKASEIIRQLESSVPAAQIQPKPVDVTPKLLKNATSSVDVNKKTNNDNDNDNANEQTADKQTSASSVDADNGDEVDDESLKDLQNNEDNAREDEQDTDQYLPQIVNGENIKNTYIDSNNNNNNNNLKHSRLEADQIEKIREDTESSFFPYFMFLMFVVVTLYVAYHNKSKILALMIEGRRSRNYSSRSGGRRKHSSAEYRKLDSNLEEAIQSDGHVLSTQIIY
ncbi:trans-Golgi network integral membrane protein 1-like [Contarinia nasturtii]|uniref:trans-Golgi network integral membrane protein 1-like n=1 Tax=Contarinia nasturtii TaxID=265458 RepID=UPI0012D3D58C|nr:trans-Golgi network integral membrane protein 1-like [Contarinia nasturtii]